ncbi:Spindle assembly checkpoint component Mad1 [Dillenia turbinata]|uniref:Spindle assembly checkpoint component Mad1 n=1 Tax=Dillenia turbinata TaxID=194707 RepID=A0AAN8YWQ4_9MAGN
MILRTPPPSKKRRAEPEVGETPKSDHGHQLVIYEDPPRPLPETSHQPSDHMLCTYQCRQMELNNNFEKAEIERNKFRDQFRYAEQELAASKARETALQEQVLKEVNDYQERFKKQLQSYNELEFQQEMNLRKNAESSATSSEEQASHLARKLNDSNESIEREKRRLGDELEHLKRESKLSVSRVNADLERMECRAKSAEKELELLKGQLEERKQQLDDCPVQKNELERKLLGFTSPSEDVTMSTENSILVKHLREELRSIESEVQEARKLKESHVNIELLKEKILEEKSRRERAELELLKLPELQLSVKNLEEELSSWKSVTKEIPGASCPDDLLLKFATLQKEVIESMVKVGEATARMKQVEVALEASELGKQNAETEAALAKEKEEVLKAEIMRIEMILSSVTEDRDSLKNAIHESKQKNEEAGDNVANINLIQELDASLTMKESCIKKLENTLREQKYINDRQHNEIKLLNERLNNEARIIKSLEREGDRLCSEISLLESKLGHGDFSATNTKVLRMVNTLSVDNEAKLTIEALRNELQKTKEKLQAVEELKRQSVDSGQLVDSYMHFKEQIATLEKREERYKTVFADRISVFRRACCELFGYKIVMDDHQRPNGISVTRFTLLSIYAQSDDEKLEFEYESGHVTILANDYSSQPEISHQVDIFIRKMNSIPAFTANLTFWWHNRTNSDSKLSCGRVIIIVFLLDTSKLKRPYDEQGKLKFSA